MRWFLSPRRLIAVLIMGPFILLNLLVCRFFMALDYVLFFGFWRQVVTKPVFIIASPRTATTYLFHKIAEQPKMTAIKLWEIAYAPSITQKYIIIGFLRFDSLFGSPARRLMLHVTGKMLKRYDQVHVMGLNLPEEDESILLFRMSTVYLNFFYPDTGYFDDYFLFDDKIADAKRRRIMKFYYRCVQRHNYVFNRKDDKTFVSKNPAFMSKVKSLHAFFPNAVFLNINRTPAKTIPSTINLMNTVYGFFSSKKPSAALNEKTKRIVIAWYKMAHHYLNEYFPGTTLQIDFRKLVKNEDETMNAIAKMVGLDPAVFMSPGKQEGSAHVTRSAYPTLTEEETENVLEELSFLRPYCS